VAVRAADMPYRGFDRRGRGGNTAPPWWLPACAFAVMGAVHLGGGAIAAAGVPVHVPYLLELLELISAVTGGLVAAVCLARWRAEGDAPALWFGLGTLVYALCRLAVPRLLSVPAAGPVSVDLAAALRPAALAVVLALFAAGIIAPAVDTGLRPVRLLIGALLVVGTLTATVAAVPAVTEALQGSVTLVPTAALAVVALYRGRRERRWLATWFGLLLVTIAFGELAGADGLIGGPPLAAAALRLAGLLLAAHGAVQEMVRSLRQQGSRLLRSQVDAQRAEELIRAEHELAQERAHEARSALAAIEGATSTLERHRDRLPADVQRQLAAAVSGEVRRLQALITSSSAGEEPRAFELLDVLAPVLAVEQARGTRTACQVSDGLVADGRPAAITEILQTLFDNVRRHAPGSSVMVRAARDGHEIVLRVEDRGPGVPPAQRTRIFQRGVRATDGAGPGEGIGLYVAARLADEQGGRLWVEDRPGGGASFALALPAGTRPELLHQSPDRLQRV